MKFRGFSNITFLLVFQFNAAYDHYYSRKSPVHSITSDREKMSVSKHY